MNKASRITEAEWRVIKVIWDNHPISYMEVVDELEGKVKWKPKTIQTLIRRLVAKGAVKYEARGRTHYYSPAVKEKDYIETQGQGFLRRCFGGSVKPLVAYFVEKGDLSPSDIDELKKLLDKKKRKK